MEAFGAVREIQPAGIDGLIVYFNGTTLTQANQAVQNMKSAIREDNPVWLKALIPGYDTLLVLFDLNLADSHTVYQELRSVNPAQQATGNGQHHRLGVWYGAPQACDFDIIRRHSGLSDEQIIAGHTGQPFTVFTVGFAPGFAYMGELPESLHCPRLDSPRKRVPAGAVAIADAQTAVYPAASPGGWNLLGLCAEPLFNPHWEQPVKLQAGDTVEFYAITESQYQERLHEQR